MTALWWTLTLLLMLLGLIGTVVPLLPGTTVILAAAVGHHFLLPGRSVGWWTIGALAVLTVLSFVVDFVSGAVGAKYFGATRWGALGVDRRGDRGLVLRADRDRRGTAGRCARGGIARWEGHTARGEIDLGLATRRDRGGDREGGDWGGDDWVVFDRGTGMNGRLPDTPAVRCPRAP